MFSHVPKYSSSSRRLIVLLVNTPVISSTPYTSESVMASRGAYFGVTAPKGCFESYEYAKYESLAKFQSPRRIENERNLNKLLKCVDGSVARFQALPALNI